MENGSMESSMAMESGKGLLATIISASGYRTKLTATVNMNGQTEIDTRANGSSVCATVRAQTLSPTVMSISASITMAKLMVTVNTDGRTGTPTQASSLKA